MAERQVVFYECQDIPDEAAFDQAAAVKGINKLKDADWRVVDGDSHIAVIVDSGGGAKTPIKLRLLRIRTDAPFRLTAARKLQPVDVGKNESITEFTWAMIWPDGYMGAISSRDAPEHKRLAFYFHATSAQNTHIVNLLRPDLPQRLKELKQGGLRQVQVKAQTAKLQQKEIDKKKTGFGQFWNAGKGTDAATIGVDLSVGRSGPDATLSKEISAGVTYLADHIEAVESLHVKGRNKKGDIETINLKQERIKDQVDVSYGASNSDVYGAIKRAREKIEKEIGSLAKATRGS